MTETCLTLAWGALHGEMSQSWMDFHAEKNAAMVCGVKPKQKGSDRGQAWSNRVITKPVKKLKGHNGYVKEGTDTY